MDIIYPPYFDTFRCIAGSCPDSCCKEWDVDVNEDAAAYRRHRCQPFPHEDRHRGVY